MPGGAPRRIREAMRFFEKHAVIRESADEHAAASRTQIDGGVNEPAHLHGPYMEDFAEIA
jgi:hypothetical protein